MPNIENQTPEIKRRTLRPEVNVARFVGKSVAAIQVGASRMVASILPELNGLTPISSRTRGAPKRSGDHPEMPLSEKYWRAGLRKTHPEFTEEQINERITRQKDFLDGLTPRQHIENAKKVSELVNDYKAGRISLDSLKDQLKKLTGPIAED